MRTEKQKSKRFQVLHLKVEHTYVGMEKQHAHFLCRTDSSLYVSVGSHFLVIAFQRELCTTTPEENLISCILVSWWCNFLCKTN